MKTLSIILTTVLSHICCQIALFTYVWVYYKTNNDFRCVCKKFQDSFPLAKSSAALITLNSSLLILFSVKFFKRYIWVPSIFNMFHYIFASYILIWSVVHSIAHYVNFTKLHNPPYFDWGVGYTGIILWIVLISLFVVSSSYIRKVHYHKFIYYHSFASFVFFAFLFLHQSFCFIKNDRGNCPLPTSWLVVTLPLFVFFTETVWKYVDPNSRLVIKQVVKHNNIIEIRLPLTKSFAGKTVWLCCPQISLFEWHPFAVTDHENDVSSIHFKPRGNWTTKFAKVLGVEFHNSTTGQVFPVILPYVLVQGPFHCYPKNILQTLQTQDSIIVANGIGITTFAYLLSQIETLTKSLTVLFIVKHPKEMDWLIPTLHTLSSKFKTVNINISCTQIKETENNQWNQLKPSDVSFISFKAGRIDITSFIHSHYISTLHVPLRHTPKTKIYFSGTSEFLRDLKKKTQSYTRYYDIVKL